MPSVLRRRRCSCSCHCVRSPNPPHPPNPPTACARQVGPLLMDLAPSGLTTIMDRLRRIVSEGDVDTRTQYIVEGLFSLRKANFEG